jgi:DNA-binding transcriptional MerR regulator
MNTFTIKDLENLSGIKAHTIRIWEQRYHFLKPQRTDTNIRYYSNHELKTLLNIALLNKYGYKISHIDKMEEQELQNKIIALSGMEAYQDRLVNDLIHCMIELDVDKFENLLDCYIISKGIEKSITQIIFPFMERIGILWMTNHIHPVQEHLVTNIIRQKLMVGIEGIVNHVAVDKTILLFLPENEHHELGLLFAHYLFRKRGAKVLYLGASVPVNDLEYLCHQKKPDYLYTHLTCMPGNLNFEKFIAFKNQALKHIPLVLSGQLALAQANKPIPSVYFKKSLAEVQEFIAML